MSIFGVKRKQEVESQLKTLTELQRYLWVLNNKVENFSDKKIITIFAESKGTLQDNEVFSFGYGGKDDGAGYVMNFRGQILGMGVSSKRTNKDDVSVIVAINGIHKKDILYR